ncbi:XRE family transcriptional regulator, partial [Salmonella enterica subsp. enterica serovar Heidelberg]
MIAKTDSDIRHVTPSGGNVFADLGFDSQDAEK